MHIKIGNRMVRRWWWWWNLAIKDKFNKLAAKMKQKQTVKIKRSSHQQQHDERTHNKRWKLQRAKSQTNGDQMENGEPQQQQL